MDELLRAAHAIARYWSRSAPWLADEFESAAFFGMAEAIARHDPERSVLRSHAIWTMHARCRDVRRAWVIGRFGHLRATTVQFPIEPAEPPHDDTRWLLAQLLRTVDEARAGGRISAKARAAVLLWLELERQDLVAERLGVSESRVSQLVHEVIDAVREIGVAS